MADLLKQRARKPLMEGAIASSSKTWHKDKVAYRIDLYQTGGHDHHIILSRDEMLRMVASWMEAEARDATEAAKKVAPAPTGTPTP